MKHAITAAALLLLAMPANAATILAPITAHQALSNVGQCVKVEGTASVRRDPQRLGWDVDIDGKNSAFLGYVIPGNQQQFPLQSLDGQTVDITGVVHLYLGRAEVRLANAPQLKIAVPGQQTGGLTHIGPEFARYGDDLTTCG